MSEIRILALGDVVGDTDCKYVNLIGKETHIDMLSDKADEVFQTSTMEDFVTAGLIEFPDTEEGNAKRTKFIEKFGTLNMNGFVDAVLAVTP